MLIKRLSVIGIFFWFSSPFTFSAEADAAHITSQAELTRYLHDVSPGTSPLDNLSPGGRKRFLGQLVFGSRGLGGASTDDPKSELTHPQAVQLYALFGDVEIAEGIGLSPASYARIQHERVVDAARRGCDVKACRESDIEQRYDQLVLGRPDAALPDARRFDLESQHYDRLFKKYQSPMAVHSTSNLDLRLLRRASEFAVLKAPNPEHIGQLHVDLAEMQQRRMVNDDDYGVLYQGLMTSRQFVEAKKLATRHPAMDIGTVPTYRSTGILPKGWPTALTVDAKNQTMQREAFDLSSSLRIVVVASCHFSQDAARAIESDRQLRPLFAQHAVWLANERATLSSASDWNKKFPDQPIHIAWQDKEWAVLDSWDMPTFYVFHNGVLAKKFSGWLDLSTLKKSLRDAGALR